MSSATPSGTKTSSGDRAEADALMRDYLWGVDEREFDIVASCFAPDAQATYNGELVGSDRESIVGWLQAVLGDDPKHGPVGTRHVLGGSTLAITEAGAMTLRTSVMAHIFTREGPSAPSLAHRAIVYVDQLVRIRGHLAISRRLQYLDWAFVVTE